MGRLFLEGLPSYLFVVPAVFIVVAYLSMKMMFETADDRPQRSGEIPAARPSYPKKEPAGDTASKEIPQGSLPDYKKIASEIGTEAELRRYEQQEAAELKRLERENR